jgi:Uma2 family endonuclease
MMVVRNPDEIVYPCTDGKPMAENTLQYRWITVIKGGMDVVFKDDPNVFVAGDLLWYPVEGEPEIRAAPDTMVAIGRPKGERLSYLQWREDDLPPQVVFEVLSPSNSRAEMAAKHDFYETHGVEEYYVYDPDRLTLEVWLRKGSVLRRVFGAEGGFTSPRTNVTIKMDPDLILVGPDGRAFVDYPVLAEQRDEAERQRDEAQRQAETATQLRRESENRLLDETRRADTLAAQAEAERQRRETLERENEAERLRAEEERRRREEAVRETERTRAAFEALRELLKSRGLDPDSLK